MENLRQSLYDRLPGIAVLMTTTAKALAERLVRDEGFKAVYSSETFPAYLLKGKEKSGAGLKRIEEAIDNEEEMNWADLRRAEGLPTSHVNLSYTNKMWAGMSPREPYWSNNIIYAPLGGNNEEVIDKMNWNKARYGDFIGKVLSKRELDLLAEVVMDEIKKVIDASKVAKQV